MSVVRFPTFDVGRKFADLVDEVKAKALAGDEFATRCLAAMALLDSGWRYGDPDPIDPDDGNDGESIPIAA